MHYYTIALLGLSAPELTYFSTKKLEKGRVVEVPLKTSIKRAIILQEVAKPSFETVEITSVLDESYDSVQLEVAKFISEYYFSAFGEAVAIFSPYNSHSGRDPESATHVSSHAWILNQVQDDGTVNKADDQKIPILSNEQQEAYTQLMSKDRALLFGVTGSGKTEIFISMMAAMLEQGRASIFLMPEISLTPQMEKRLKAYFGETVAIWHSRLTKKKKASILEGIHNGKVRIVAGARSALFVPLRDLGLIVVDEEHDESYKSSSRPRYHARDVALLMGQKLGAKVLLASATPSAASFHKYDVVRLEKPYITTKKTYRFVSGDTVNTPIIAALKKRYQAHEQSLLFLPTRGNFKYLYCDHCGTTHTCPYCSVGMALHRNRRHLKCHYCNFTEPIRETCTVCGHGPLKSERIGTAEAIELIAEEIENIAVEQFDRDAITTPKKLKEALARFESGESDLLLGTQMLSKGHDYPNITLAVILGLDHIMGLSDYRARERAVSLMHQIAGRSGRAKEAEVIIQTANPENFQPYLFDYTLFLREELEFLRAAHYPPFAVLARILIAHKDEAKAAKITLDTVTQLKKFGEIEIVGHGKAPIEKIAAKHRFVILLRSEKRVALLKALHSVDCREIEIDMDPVEFS